MADCLIAFIPFNLLLYIFLRLEYFIHLGGVLRWPDSALLF